MYQVCSTDRGQNHKRSVQLAKQHFLGVPEVQLSCSICHDTCILTFILFIRTYMHACMHACMHTYIYIRKYPYTYKHPKSYFRLIRPLYLPTSTDSGPYARNASLAPSSTKSAHTRTAPGFGRTSPDATQTLQGLHLKGSSRMVLGWPKLKTARFTVASDRERVVELLRLVCFNELSYCTTIKPTLWYAPDKVYTRVLTRPPCNTCVLVVALNESLITGTLLSHYRISDFP